MLPRPINDVYIGMVHNLFNWSRDQNLSHDYAKRPRAARSNAKKTPSDRVSQPSPRPSVPGWLWLVVGTVIGAFVMFLVRLADIDPEMPSVKVATSQPVSSNARQPTKAVAKSTTPDQATPVAVEKSEQKPRFDFYTILKEDEVPVVTRNDGDPPQTQPAKPRTFILQVASFKKPEDAEELRVRLLLLDLEAATEEVTVRNGEVWHRVLVGPFDNRSQLSKARATLISNNHQALVLEYKKKEAG